MNLMLNMVLALSFLSYPEMKELKEVKFIQVQYIERNLGFPPNIPYLSE